MYVKVQEVLKIPEGMREWHQVITFNLLFFHHWWESTGSGDVVGTIKDMLTWSLILFLNYHYFRINLTSLLDELFLISISFHILLFTKTQMFWYSSVENVRLKLILQSRIDETKINPQFSFLKRWCVFVFLIWCFSSFFTL